MVPLLSNWEKNKSKKPRVHEWTSLSAYMGCLKAI